MRQIAVQPAGQRGGLFARGRDRDAVPPQRRGDAVVFSVTDRGPGIPADDQDKVFDWFESHIRSARAIAAPASACRSCAPSSSCMAATVTLDSAVGRGTTVTCVFPLEQQDRAHGGVMLRARSIRQRGAGMR